MRLSFTQDKQFLYFLHEDTKEYKFLMKFPAFVREGPYFCVAAKPAVVHNVVARLKRSKKKLLADPDVVEFLNRPFKLEKLPESFKFHTSPMDYQEIALRYIYTTGSAGLLLDPGMGKSKVVLDYIFLAGFKKTIVVCPKPLMFVWEDEIAVHRPELSYYSVKTTDWDKEAEGVAKAQVVIVNYNKAVTFQHELAKIGAEFLHLDEFLIKDPSTDRTKALTALSKKVAYRAGGSGTLINNSLLDVFSPVRYIEPSLVGWNYTNFKDKYTVKNPKDPKQIVAYRGIDEARSILESCCIVMTKEKWLAGKLPPKRFHDISVSLTDEQREVYWQLTRNYVAKVGEDYVEVDNPLVMLSKLYQISNGFLYINDQESESDNEVGELLAEDSAKKPKKKRRTYFFENNAKNRALEELLTKTLPSKRAIIWYNMSAEGESIRALLDRLGHTYLIVKGGEADVGGKVRKFNRDNSIQWLVCQAKSVNYGITVLGTSKSKVKDIEDVDPSSVFPGLATEVHTQVFYSLNFSLEVYLQQQDRIHRLGQEHICDYYRIFAGTPVEAKIKEAISTKMSVRHEMLVDVAEKLVEEAGGGKTGSAEPQDSTASIEGIEC